MVYIKIKTYSPPHYSPTHKNETKNKRDELILNDICFDLMLIISPFLARLFSMGGTYKTRVSGRYLHT